MRAEHLMEIALTLFPKGTRVQAARSLADAVNRRIAKDMQRSERTVEAYCQGQRKIPMEYAVSVMSYLQEFEPSVYEQVSQRVQEEVPVASGAELRVIDIEQVLNRMEKTVDKMQAATQSTGMLLAIRAMCADCAGGPASNPENTCWWKNCPLRSYSDHVLAPNAQTL